MSPMVRLILGTAVLVVVYFAFPVHAGGDAVVRALATVLGLALVTVLVARQVQHQVRGKGSPLWGLALALVAAVLAFALTDYIIAFTEPGQFVGLNTRLDGLYFAVTTLATVGYGDVHAQGQLARTVVTIQMGFNIVVLTTAASVLLSQIRSRAGRSAGE